MADPLQLQHEKITCTGSQALCALSNYVISLSLGGLTGVKAAIPMLLVAIGDLPAERLKAERPISTALGRYLVGQLDLYRGAWPSADSGAGV
ncbi:hypothetical protein AK812_SmicGene22045 [Symbiodinium microadriaticum]|uniref:Uncharacterized protein n=1 Tax=Symbiodinium microadriaticum TaxID=2951 RepID=A0A1Q9DKS5_SYMMI|nr:hypothetical protein AK812_SmicGene22045 [Symbiodinium microadriaticum]